MTKTYTGSCHCKAVQFEADLDLAAGTTRCNCTFCTKARMWFAIAKVDAVRITHGAADLADYQRAAGDKAPFLHFHFCKVCGVRPFTRGGHLPSLGSEFYAVNVAALDLSDAELSAIPFRCADGRHDDWSKIPEHHAHM